MALALPIVGRWIKWKEVEGGTEYKGKVTGFEDIEGWQMDAMSGFQATLERSVTIQYEDGGVDSIDECMFKGWTYCEAPDEDELVDAVNNRLNQEMELACARCGCDTKKLSLCSGCHQVYYFICICHQVYYYISSS